MQAMTQDAYINDQVLSSSSKKQEDNSSMQKCNMICLHHASLTQQSCPKCLNCPEPNSSCLVNKAALITSNVM